MDIIAIPGFSEPVSSLSHLLTAGLALIGSFPLLYRARGSALRIISLVVFTISLVFLFSMSGVYHLLERGGSARRVLLHLDHAAIWTLIAGTFTPIQVILFRGFWRWGVFAFVWTVAITGLVLKIIFFEDIPQWLGLAFYLGLGWVGLVSGIKIKSMYGAHTKKFHFFWMGGVAYSIGAVIDYIQWPILIGGVVGPHEIFHFFVILGALFHWLFVYHWADLPVGNLMSFKVRIYPGDKYIAKSSGDNLKIEASALPELREKIKKAVREKYPNSVQPEILLRFFNEEKLQ